MNKHYIYSHSNFKNYVTYFSQKHKSEYLDKLFILYCLGGKTEQNSKENYLCSKQFLLCYFFISTGCQYECLCLNDLKIKLRLYYITFGNMLFSFPNSLAINIGNKHSGHSIFCYNITVRWNTYSIVWMCCILFM